MSQSVPGGTVSGATRPEAGGTVSGATRPASGASSRADAVDVLVIDDHEIVSMGVRQALESGPIRAEVRWTASLTPVIRLSPGTVAVLDLRLDDGSSPAANIAHLHAHGIPVVIYTSGDEPVLIREAIAAGALSIVRKASPARHLVEAIAAALQGRVEPGLDWAAALEADEDFVQTHLSDGEVQVLIRYAAGETSEAVARHLNLSRSTVNTYIARIRAKYHQAGRPADSRVDLFRRAAEDGLVSYHDSGATTPTRP